MTFIYQSQSNKAGDMNETASDVLTELAGVS